MMQDKNTKGTDFLSKISAPNLSKKQLFDALFDARGTGDDINTKHVFFQEVIIKFNASKAAASKLFSVMIRSSPCCSSRYPCFNVCPPHSAHKQLFKHFYFSIISYFCQHIMSFILLFLFCFCFCYFSLCCFHTC